MFMRAKTVIKFKNYWLDHLKYKDHTDYDLAGPVQAIALKSESGSVYDFYRSNALEQPKDFKYTKLYEVSDDIADIVDFFKLDTTRIRIHKQSPNSTVKLHTDDNNTAAKTKEDYRLRLITALNGDDNFVYKFEVDGVLHEFSLKQGESVIFDPDKVKHGMENLSSTKNRYALVQIFRAYPMSEWLKNFINQEQSINVSPVVV